MSRLLRMWNRPISFCDRCRSVCDSRCTTDAARRSALDVVAARGLR